jgi:hypothetical protein
MRYRAGQLSLGGRFMPKTIEELAPCGVDCTSCNIYRATAGLEELRQETIDSYTELARIHWRMDSLDPALLKCRGCRYEAEGKLLGGALCPIRRCSRERNLISCSVCPDMNTCAWLQEEGRKNFEKAAAYSMNR